MRLPSAGNTRHGGSNRKSYSDPSMRQSTSGQVANLVKSEASLLSSLLMLSLTTSHVAPVKASITNAICARHWKPQLLQVGLQSNPSQDRRAEDVGLRRDDE
eukprot:8758887-Pyramimonas_sp.AAC.1